METPQLTNLTTIIVLTDNQLLVTILRSLFATVHHRTLIELVTSNSNWLWPEPPLLLWIDLPVGARLRAVKTGALEDTLSVFINDAQGLHIPVVMMLPWTTGDNLPTFPHRRWTRLLKRWRPQTTVHCACRYIDRQEGIIHHKSRAFTTNLEITDRTCAVPNQHLTQGRSGRAHRYFLRRWIQQWLLNAEGQQDSVEDPVPTNEPKHCALVQPCSSCTTDEAQLLPDSAGYTESDGSTTQAYPTDSKEREREQRKADKEKGIEHVVKKRKQVVEDHHDDCGEDLGSIVDDLDAFVDDWTDYLMTGIGDDVLEDNDDPICDNLSLFMLWGEVPYKPEANLLVVYPSNTEELLSFLNAKGDGIDIAEVCGGEARATQLGVRRRLRTGRNFDLVTDFDLTNSKDAHFAYQYFVKNDVLVAVMAPVCGPYGPISTLTQHMYPETYQRRLAEARPLARFTGEVAMVQLGKRNNHFLQEQPSPSHLYEEQPWPRVLRDSRVDQAKYDRCKAGLKVLSGANKGLHIKKPSTMTASHPALLAPFRGLLCTNQHRHASDAPPGMEASRLAIKDSQVWTWEEANRVVEGICMLRRAVSVRPERAYPINHDTVARAQPGGVPLPHGRDPRAVPKAESTCPGCNHVTRPRNDWTHTREIGQCSYPYDEPWIPTCESCIRRLQREHHGHTGREGCRNQIKATRMGLPRQGRHPRDPARPATEDPTMGMPGTAEGHELGADGEAAVEELEAARPAAEPEAASSSTIGDHRIRRPHPNPRGSTLAEPRGGSSGDSSGSHQRQGARGRVPREPAAAPQGDQAWRDQRSGPGNNADWRQFDIQRVLRVLRMGTEAQCRLTLRKLHQRWWHASTAAMTRLLERAGVPRQALNLIPSIVQTCGPCRKWAKPSPDSVASIDIADEFNKAVEADLGFFYKSIVFHMIDRCTRWYHSLEIDNKEDDSLINGVDSWCSIHGPMQDLYMDGETAMAKSHKMHEFLHRRGINYRPRAPGQQVSYIDRRTALVRDVIHRIVEQLRVDGIEVPFRYILSEATFCTNAMLSVNGYTPYNAVYGRVPHLLPGLDQFEAENERSLPNPGTIRHTHRLREIAVQCMIEETARKRAERALSSRTRPAGQREDYKPGDLVDFFRKGGAKDATGWTGPAKVVDPTHIDRGTVTIRHLHLPMECRLQDLRHHQMFMVFLAASYSAMSSSRTVWGYIRNAIEQMRSGMCVLLGSVLTKLRSGGYDWRLSQKTHSSSHYRELYQAIEHFARNGLSQEDVVAARCGQGCASIPALSGYDSALTVWWQPGNDTVHRITQDLRDGNTNMIPTVQFQKLDTRSWQTIRFLQVLSTSAEVHTTDPPLVDDRNPDNLDGQPREHTPQGILTPITEEPSDFDPEESLFHHDEPILQEAADLASYCCLEYSNDLECSVSSAPDYDTINDSLIVNDSLTYLTDGEDYSNNYHLIAANVRAGLPSDYNLDEEIDRVDLYFEGDAHKLAYQDGRPDPVTPGDNEVLLVQDYFKKTNKKVVVERDDANLTKDEETKHWPEVAAAIQKELETWVKYKCVSRKKRADAKNIIDVRWVLKWKWETEARDASTSEQGESAKRRVIRARLCLRGFKDLQAQELASYAGTSQRYSQRVLVSEAVLRRWDIATTDISKAFLQGVTYEELAAATGEPLREVNFYLPGYCIPYLRKIPGFQDFDPQTEVLHCDKPGTGCNDAPRCFSMKLAKVTRDMCGMTQCTVDNELCFLHKPVGSTLAEDRSVTPNKVMRLLAVMAKHVDDLKITGDKATVIWILQQIEQVFGKLKIDWNNFTNCGVRHIQDTTTKEVSLDQTLYISGIKVITHDDLRNKPAESLCSQDVHQSYWSVLGAIAFAALTRPDIGVFISALQRHSQTPKIIHAKRLNAVVRWAQRNPRKIVYKPLDKQQRPAGTIIATHLREYSDAAFKKEEHSGHSMRGAVYIRTLGNTEQDMITTQPGHLIDFTARQQRRVTRATFTAELLSACDAQDKGFLLAQMLHEIVTGDTRCSTARQLRDNGGYAIPMALYIDAMSVFSATTATFVKTPADNGVLCHIQYLRELLDEGILFAFVWADTRDMLADGLTKGSIDREQLHALMDGKVEVKHDIKIWRPTHLRRK